MTKEIGPKIPSLRLVTMDTPEDHPVDMDAFRAEIDGLIAKVKAGQPLEIFGDIFGTNIFNVPELATVNSQDLTETDARMWYRLYSYFENPITDSDFATYYAGVRVSQNPSRLDFKGVIANILTSLSIHRQMSLKSKKDEK